MGELIMNKRDLTPFLAFALTLTVACGCAAAQTMDPSMMGAMMGAPPDQQAMSLDAGRVQEDQMQLDQYRGFESQLESEIQNVRAYRPYATTRLKLLKSSEAASHSPADAEEQMLSKWLRQETAEEPVMEQQLANLRLWITHFQEARNMD